MNLKNRIKKLEDEYLKEGGKEQVVYVMNYGGGKLPDPEKEIARQRAEGKKLIVVEVSYKEKEMHS
jgi:hypothetical protein